MGADLTRGARIRRPLTWVLVVTGLAILAGAGFGVFTLIQRVTSLSKNECVVTVPATASGDSNDAMQRFHFDTDQVHNASIITSVALRRELPERAVVIALATALQESKLHNLDYGDRDSLGLFQQRPSQGWGTEAQVQDPRYAAGKFFDTLVKVKNWQTRPLTEAAQAVQRSGFPNAYARWEPRSTALADALTGSAPATLACRPPDTNRRPATAETVSRVISEELQLPASLDPTSPNAVVVQTATTDSIAHRPWTVANWAVANASDLGISNVTVDGKTWSTKDPSWRNVKDGGDQQRADVVRIELPSTP